jgi:AcrR family transcriptional regulator
MPKIVQHDVKREEIAAAVWRAIARVGIEASTVREIAREAGCSTGVLVHYFPDKDALLIHALRLATARAGSRMALRSRNLRGLAALRMVVREALPIDEDSVVEWRIWLSFWGRAIHDAALAAEQARRYEEWRGLVRALISDAQRADELRKQLSAEREADALVALIDGIGIQATLEPHRLTPKRQTALVDRYLDRLRRPR